MADNILTRPQQPSLLDFSNETNQINTPQLIKEVD